MEIMTDWKELHREIDEMERRVAQLVRPPAPPTPAQQAAARKRDLPPISATLPIVSFYDDELESTQWPRDGKKLRYFYDLYSGSKDKPVVLRKQHVDEIDKLRKTLNSKRHYPWQDAVTTSDVVNACLDAVFSRPALAPERLEKRDKLAELIFDHLQDTSVARWRALNG